MRFAKVIGTVVSTHKDENAEGWKMLIVQPLALDWSPKGEPLVAVDAVGAGEDELVLLCAGSSARQTEMTKNKPCDLVIMAVIDAIEKDGTIIFKKFETEGFK